MVGVLQFTVFFCTVMDFSAAEKDSGVKLRMRVRLLSRSKVKVTQRISSNNAITRQRMVVISTSNLVESFIVRYATQNPLSRSVGQLDLK